MSLSINTRHLSSVTILDLDGRITLGEGTGMLREAVKEVLARGEKSILLNLGNVFYIDRAGLGALVGCSTNVKNAGGMLQLLQVQKKIKDPLLITKRHTILYIVEEQPHVGDAV